MNIDDYCEVIRCSYKYPELFSLYLDIRSISGTPKKLSSGYGLAKYLKQGVQE